MYKGKSLAIVVPAFNEQELILETLKGIPNYVDIVIVIDDCSTDKTYDLVKTYSKTSKIEINLIKNNQNRGVGGSIKRGYEESLKKEIDIISVMAGDNQMDPEYLPKLLDPLVKDIADYSKGNRLHHPLKRKMPLFRRFGNNILTLLNKISTGYWNISDPQNGYTAITKLALLKLDLRNVYSGYGYCNDLLSNANIHNLRVHDVVMPPVYGNEVSGIKIGRYMILMLYLLTRGFFNRIQTKYGGPNFHPILLSYYISFISIIILILMSFRMLYTWYNFGYIPLINSLAVGILFIFSTQIIALSMWMDSNNS